MMTFQSVDTTDLDRIADSLQTVQVTWQTGIAALAVVIAAFIAARYARKAILRVGRQTDLTTPGVYQLIGRLVWYLIVFFGVGAALSIIGFNFVPLMTFVGIFLIIAAFGLRPFFENFAGGLVLQTRHPFQVGDEVSLVDVEGTVAEITSRSVRIETVDGERVYVPNRHVLDYPIVNYSVNGVRRSSLDFGLDYRTDLALATSVLTEAVAGVDRVREDPPPVVTIHEFDDSTINARAWFWHDPGIFDAWEARHDVAVEAKRALDAAGITIAFPQRVLWNGDATAGD